MEPQHSFKTSILCHALQKYFPSAPQQPAVSSVKGFASGLENYLESEVIEFNEQLLIKQNITQTVTHPRGHEPQRSSVLPRTEVSAAS